MKRSRQPLPAPELHAILRAADSIIDQGGRTLLSKILKGSKDRKLLELGLDRNPSYGYYKELTQEQVLEKIDHMIRTDFLETEKRGKLPMIIFTPRGWLVERERRAEEFLREWDRWLEAGVAPASMEYLKERNRGMIFLLLYKAICSGDKKYIPFLKLWEKIDFKKVQSEIRHAIRALEQRETLNEAEWEQLLLKYAESLLIPSKEPIFMACQSCGRPFILDDANPDYYTSVGFQFPSECVNCREQG